MGSLKTPVVGTELKMRVGVSTGNTNWKDLDANNPSIFTLEFYVGDYAAASSADKVVTISGNAPTDIIKTGDHAGTYLALVDTGKTGPGILMLRVTLDIYDEDMEDEPDSDESTGYRREVAEYNTRQRIYDV